MAEDRYLTLSRSVTGSSRIGIRRIQRQQKELVMLRIIVELVPGGYEPARRELARAELGNISNLAAVSDYTIRAGEGPNPLAGAPPWQRRGMILGHSREQSVWRLVERAASWCGNEADNAGTD